jgi:hypothetical protein
MGVVQVSPQLRGRFSSRGEGRVRPLRVPPPRGSAWPRVPSGVRLVSTPATAQLGPDVADTGGDGCARMVAGSTRPRPGLRRWCAPAPPPGIRLAVTPTTVPLGMAARDARRSLTLGMEESERGSGRSEETGSGPERRNDQRSPTSAAEPGSPMAVRCSSRARNSAIFKMSAVNSPI